MSEDFVIHLFQDKAEEWRWHVTANNNEIVADSAEGYHNKTDAEAIAKELHPDMKIVEDGAL